MNIAGIIISVFFVITIGIAIYEYIKMCSLLNEHSEESLEDVMPELNARLKKIKIIIFALAGCLIIYLILDLIFEIL